MKEMSPRRGRKREVESSGAEDSEDYRKKRDRNNLAVKRSRVKSKQKAEETLQRVNQLRQENTVLEGKVKALTQELGFLKELFLAHASNSAESKKKFENVDLQTLLAEDPGDQNNT